jgi:hypothetical protein
MGEKMEDDRKTPEEIAKEKMEQITKEKAEKAEAGLTPEEKQKRASEAEAKAKVDEEILAKDEADLSEPEKTRKAELEEIKSKKTTPEEKIQKRFDELTGQIKSLKNERVKDVERIEKLEQEKADLEKKIVAPKAEEEKVDALKKAETERLGKYLEEDKDKPLAERREMSKEELEGFLSDDYVAATEWIAERSIRRATERHQFKNKTDSDVKTKVFIEKQNASAAKTLEKHPELNVDSRIVELKAEGKSAKEIHETISKENVKYRLANKIIAEHPEYFQAENGPELVVAEMERQLKKPSSPKETEEEREARIREEGAEAERQRQGAIDEGLDPSQRGRKPDNKGKSEFQIKQEKIAQRAGITPERLKAINERRKKIPGLAMSRQEDNE